MLRSAIKETTGWFLRVCYFRLFPLRGSCIVLMCHRVLESRDITPWNQDISVSRVTLSTLLRQLAGHFEAVDLHQWLDNPRPSRPAFAVTFDDGWRDNYTHALPVLRNLRVPATVFVTVGLVGTSEQFWWDRIARVLREGRVADVATHFAQGYGGHGPWPSDPVEVFRVLVDNLKALPQRRIDELVLAAEHAFGVQPETERVMLTWEELGEMGRAGVSVGSHGMSHAILVPLSDEAKWFELSQSALILSQKRIPYVPIMCFPNGTYDQQSVDLSLACGYRALVTAGANRISTRRGLMVHRIGVNARTTTNALFVRIFVENFRGRLLSAKKVLAQRVSDDSALRARES